MKFFVEVLENVWGVVCKCVNALIYAMRLYYTMLLCCDILILRNAPVRCLYSMWLGIAFANTLKTSLTIVLRLYIYYGWCIKRKIYSQKQGRHLSTKHPVAHIKADRHIHK